MNKNSKKEPWRIIVFSLSLLYIIFMFIKKDIAGAYVNMSAGQMLPLIATTVVVYIVKIGAIAGFILLVRWIVRKIKKQ